MEILQVLQDALTQATLRAVQYVTMFLFQLWIMGGGMVALTTLAVTAWNLVKTLSRRLAMVILN